LKILFHHRIASADGQFVHLTELTKALRAAGDTVLVVGPAIDEGSDLGNTSGLVKALKKMLPASLYEIMEFCYSLVATIRLLRAALKFKPDAIYERYNLHLHAGRFVARWLKIPFLMEINAPLAEERSVYGSLKLKRFAHWSECSSWHSADYALPVTDVLADHVRKCGVPEPQIAVIPNGIDTMTYEAPLSGEKARTQLKLEGQVVLGFVGFVRDWHGMSHIIDYVASRQDKKVTILIVGDGLDRAKLEQQAKDLGIGDQLKITGFVPRTAVPDLVASFDIALQPAVTPWASPLKLFEYMAQGCAIVAPNTPNIEEVLTNDDNALLFPVGDQVQLVAAIERLCSDDLLRQRLGKRARELVFTQPYTWEGNAKTVQRLIKSL
jgi:glycosyltransferase involved in cell wall biosynthesis